MVDTNTFISIHRQGSCGENIQEAVIDRLRKWAESRNEVLRLMDESGKSLRQIAREIGLSHGGLSQLIEAEDRVPQPRTLRKILDWAEKEARRMERIQHPATSGDTVHERTPHYGEDEETARTLVIDPNLARRVLGKFSKDDVKTRVAIIREFEDVFLEAGVTPDHWPAWFRELREEVFGST